MATTYYVQLWGDDSKTGTSPNAALSAVGPWQTLAKALGTGTPVVAGDSIICGPGVLYCGGSVTMVAGISTTASPTQLIGDPANIYGFRDRAGVPLLQDDCIATTRTAAEGEDTGNWASSAGLLIASGAPTINGLQIRNMYLETRPDAGACIQLAWAGNSDWLIEQTFGIGLTFINYPTGAPTAARNLTVRGNEFHGTNFFSFVANSAAATADADLVILAEANIIHARLTQAGATLGASGGNLAGGVIFAFNDVFLAGVNGQNAIQTTALRVSTVTPMRLIGNKFLFGLSVNAGTAGHVVSDGENRYYRNSTVTNFTPHASDKDWPLLRVNSPSRQKWGIQLPTSEHFAWNPSAASTLRFSGATRTNADFRGRTARPWGAGPSVGAWEAGNATQGTDSQITGGGANYLKMVGAGEQNHFVRLKGGVTTTITVVTESVSYGGTNWPQMIAEASPLGGLAQTTATATSATEQALTLTLTPTADCVVELRFVSRSSSTSSTTRFDTLKAA